MIGSPISPLAIPMYKINYKLKRAFTLLEVLVAFLLIAIAIIPLLAPYPYMLKKQKAFLKELEIDRLANIYYVDLLAKILKKEIDISPNNAGIIELKTPQPFQVTYLFGENEVYLDFLPHKESQPTRFTYYLGESNEKE